MRQPISPQTLAETKHPTKGLRIGRKTGGNWRLIRTYKTNAAICSPALMKSMQMASTNTQEGVSGNVRVRSAPSESKVSSFGACSRVW